MVMALHRLSSITVGVPDVASTSGFYEAFGLTPTSPGSFATRNGGEQLRLRTAPWRRLEEIAVGVDDNDDVERIARALTDAGHVVTRAEGGLRSVEAHSGVTLVLSVESRTQTSAVPAAPTNQPGSTPRLNRPADVVMGRTPVQPAWLSHLVIGTPNYDATLAFFTTLVGFEVSDQIPGVMSFTRCSDTHHNLAIQKMPGRFLHHVAFEVDSADDVLRGGSNMIEADAERHVWGLGRHAIGSNWFWYLRDPAGNYVEYTADLDRITAQDLYMPKDWAGKEYLYAYGPPVPGVFLAPTDAEEIFAAQVG